MNELTERVVTETALKYKAAAKKNDITFDFKVRDAHWVEMISLYGWQLKQRAVEIWAWFHPEMYVDGYLDDGCPRWFDIDMELSYITERVLKRKVARDKDLQLLDWGDLPKRIADPQMRMF